MSRSYPVIIPMPIYTGDDIGIEVVGVSAALIGGLIIYSRYLRPRFQMKLVPKTSGIHVMVRGHKYPSAPHIFHQNIDKLSVAHHPVKIRNILENCSWKTVYKIESTQSIKSIMQECKKNEVHTEFQYAYNTFWTNREILIRQKLYWHKHLQKELQ